MSGPEFTFNKPSDDTGPNALKFISNPVIKPEPVAGEVRIESGSPKLTMIVVFLVMLVVGGLGSYMIFVSQSKEDTTPPQIIMADEGETKHKPENPGGVDVPFQNKLVFERLDPKPTEETATKTEQLLPPAEQPAPAAVDVATAPPAAAVPTPPKLEEKAIEAMAPKPVPATPAQAAVPEAPAPVAAANPVAEDAATTKDEPSVPPATAENAEAVRAEAAKNLSAAMAEKAKTVDRPTNLKPKAEKLTEDKSNSIIPKLVPPVQTMAEPKPQASPPKAAKKAEAAPAAVVAAPSVAKPVPTGSRNFRVQLASFPAEDTARAESRKFGIKYGPELGNVGLDIVRADLGSKGIYYRVQSTPIDEATARSLCAAIKEKNGACILVRP